MFGRMNWLRLGALVILVAALAISLPAAPSRAQDTPTETPAGDAATGLLTIATTTCARDDQPEGAITVVTPGSTDAFDCTPGAPATLSVDGAEPVEVQDGDQLELPAGTHTITETTQGSQLAVEIAEDGETAIEITTAVAPVTAAEDPTETPVSTETATVTATVPASGTVRVVSHLCREGIGRTELEAQTDWTQQLLDCPALTLPGNYGDVPAEYTSANDPDDPLAFDVTLAFDTGAGATTESIGDAAFTPGALCESGLGANLNGVATDDHCWDLSGYQVDDIAPGAVTITADPLPEGYLFGLASADDQSGDRAAITGYDADAGTVQLDTSADGDVVVHLFFVPDPPVNSVTIVNHLCGAGIDSRGDFDAIGDYWAAINACPSIVVTGDAPAPGSITSGPVDFAIEIEGADAVKQQLADVPFDQRAVCEAELPVDINGNPNDDICLDLSEYDVANVAQGPITIRAGKLPPPGAAFVGISFLPDSGDDATVTGVGRTGTIKLDTTNDGHVTIHVFYGPLPPATATPAPTMTPSATATTAAPTSTPTRAPTKTETPTGPTPTPTATGTTSDPTATNTPVAGTGSVQIFKFWCEGDESLTRINALAPGADASRSDLGDATCQNGNTDFILFDAAGSQLQTVTVPPIGVILVDNLPVGRYSIQDTRSSATGRFEIAEDTVTKVISLHYQFVPDIPDAPDFPEIDIPDDPPPDFEDDLPVDDEGDFDFDGPVAVPDGSDPFTVVDDPEAEARVQSVDTFEEMPGVGIGPGQGGRGAPLPWLIGLVGACLSVASVRLRFHRFTRRRS